MLAAYAAAGTLPGDLLDLPGGDDAHAALMAAQAAGHVIDWAGAHPVAIDRPAPTLDQLKAAKLNAINDAAQLVASALTAGYPAFEIDTWPDQQREVLAWQADATAATPCMDTLAAHRGIPRQAYLEKTLAKVQAFRKAGWYLAGHRQRLEDQVKAAASAAAMDAIAVDFTLPQ